ncbi:MAG: hypothetical protein QNK37_02740 [Acidobacteriota bacterium]|nr:hypothetical protein [Acidobacteriota bacterium]
MYLLILSALFAGDPPLQPGRVSFSLDVKALESREHIDTVIKKRKALIEFMTRENPVNRAIGKGDRLKGITVEKDGLIIDGATRPDLISFDVPYFSLISYLHNGDAFFREKLIEDLEERGFPTDELSFFLALIDGHFLEAQSKDNTYQQNLASFHRDYMAQLPQNLDEITSEMVAEYTWASNEFQQRARFESNLSTFFELSKRARRVVVSYVIEQFYPSAQTGIGIPETKVRKQWLAKFKALLRVERDIEAGRRRPDGSLIEKKETKQ